MNMHNFLIVGSGFAGSTIAHLLNKAGYSCLVIDKNEFIGGASHDKKIDNINVSMFGAHIFHTHDEDIWKFVNQFGKWENFINKPKVISGDKIYSFPINLMTLHQFWGVKTPQEALDKLKSVQIPCNNPKNFEEWALSKIGQDLYQTFIYGYTKKQYHKEPRELPASIIQRLPIRLTFDENYFTTQYQAIPIDGYTKIIENMLEGIEVRLGINFFDMKKLAHHTIFTGEIDRFFDFQFGKLDYNTMRFEHKTFKGDYQGNAVINYCDEKIPYLRSVEHKHFINPNKYKKHNLEINDENTIVSFDIPEKIGEPYYPIRDEKNLDIYLKYNELIKKQDNLTVGGRIGLFKYFDIDQVISSGIKIVEKLLEG